MVATSRGKITPEVPSRVSDIGPDGWREQITRFPSTRYQGSKRKLLPWLLECLQPIRFRTALDAFSGTAAVAYGLKAMGKQVTANDLLCSNRRVAEALVVNDSEVLGADEAAQLLQPMPGRRYPSFVADTFGGVYFTDRENEQIDVLAANLARLEAGGRRQLAWFAAFQACLSKRPFNLFHRRNLSLRTADVPRSFGNKATWDTPIDALLRRFAEEGSAAVFQGAAPCRALSRDVLELEGEYDLVYLDPPYVPAKGAGADYLRYYHFLEGLCDYGSWADRVDHETRNLRMRGLPSEWADRRRIRGLLRSVYERFPRAVLALSYRSDGVPTAEDLREDLRRVRGHVQVHDAGSYHYVLSTNRRSRELLFVAY